MSSAKRKFHRALLKHLNEETINEIMKEIQEPSSDEYSHKIVRRISKITGQIREQERQTEAALEYARSIRQEISLNSGLAALGPGPWKTELTQQFADEHVKSQKQSFANASRIIDMFQEKDCENIYKSKLKRKSIDKLIDFMKTAQKAEKFRMDDLNWSEEAKKENQRCIEQHLKEGLGLLPFEKILFQTRGFENRFGAVNNEMIVFHLFEYKEKDLDRNNVTYSHRMLFILRDKIQSARYLTKSDVIVPLDFKKNGNTNHYLWASKDKRPARVQADNFYKAFIQLNSHTDKNASIRDIVPKSEKPSTSFKIKESNASQDEFVPVWKSKTVYIKPDEYKTEKDTTYTNDVTDDEPHEKRYIPYHSVRGHTRRLRKGDITSVRAHFRGHKEYGAIHKNYVLAAPRIIRKGKII
jgi:DNA-binding FrmR family transcriptional regulator